MSVIASHLRIGNWIHCKGSSHYGIVTGDLLALLEKEEKMREKFEGIELTGELFETIDFKDYSPNKNGMCYRLRMQGGMEIAWYKLDGILRYQTQGGGHTQQWVHIKCLHHLQNFYLLLEGSELPLPESAKLIPQEVAK